MKHLYCILFMAIALHSYAQFPDPGSGSDGLAVPDKLEIVWKFTNDEEMYVPPWTEMKFSRTKNTVVLQDSSVVTGYLNNFLDTFKLIRIVKDGEIILKKAFKVPIRSGRYFSINLDPNDNIIVVLQTQRSSNGHYALVLAKLNSNLDLVASKVYPQNDLNLWEALVDAIVLDNGSVVVGQAQYLNQDLYHPVNGFVSNIENSAMKLRFFDSTGNNYLNRTYPPDVKFKFLQPGDVPAESRDYVLKSLTKGIGGSFYATVGSYDYSSEHYYRNGQIHDRLEDIVINFTDQGNMKKMLTFTSPQLFSNLQPVNGYSFGIGARTKSDSIIACDRDLNKLPGEGFPIAVPTILMWGSAYPYPRQIRFHPDSSAYVFSTNSLYYEKYDFQGHRVWAGDLPSSSVRIPQLKVIIDITPLNNKQFLLEGNNLDYILTIVKLRERPVVTAAKTGDSSTTMIPKTALADKTGNGKLKVFPVPAKDQLNVLLPHSFTGTGFVTIYDYTGRILKTESLTTGNLIRLNISSLKPGYYLLAIYDGKGQSLQSSFIK